VADSSLILIVDDNESGRYSKVRTLQRAGFDVLEAANGTDALNIVEQRKPRLVILDTQMPDLSGWEVCSRLKEAPSTASVLVLQVSATYVREEDTVRALEGGADACLTEPIEGPVLIATVRALLRARRAEDALRDALAREHAARTAAEAANRIKDEFLATLSHELRSPIGAILTWVTLLRSGQIDAARTQRALEAIERNTRIQVQLIEDLLDVSRIISGKLRLELGAVDLGSVIRSALEAVRPAATAKGVQLIADRLPAIAPLRADAGRLHQVLWNLLSNAVKFTPKGGTVEIRLAATDSQAEIRVCDTGRGIEPAFQPHIFERFRQADSSSTRSEGGLGLGLAIVRHLVEMHGGTVRAESPGLDQGATFIVCLPLPAVATEATPAGSIGTAQAALDSPQWQALDGLRVLVVDDQLDAREAVSAVLEQCGATVVTAPDVMQALAALQGASFDVVVSDIGMPKLDGYEFIRQIRAHGNATVATLPVLALTAYGGLEDERRVFVAGFNAYLPKPVDAAHLVRAVARLAATRSLIPPPSA
jgi:signal transduction histidine kinase/BarA-like signal transduction histidine kinase